MNYPVPATGNDNAMKPFTVKGFVGFVNGRESIT